MDSTQSSNWVHEVICGRPEPSSKCGADEVQLSTVSADYEGTIDKVARVRSNVGQVANFIPPFHIPEDRLSNIADRRALTSSLAFRRHWSTRIVGPSQMTTEQLGPKIPRTRSQQRKELSGLRPSSKLHIDGKLEAGQCNHLYSHQNVVPGGDDLSFGIGRQSENVMQPSVNTIESDRQHEQTNALRANPDAWQEKWLRNLQNATVFRERRANVTEEENGRGTLPNSDSKAWLGDG